MQPNEVPPVIAKSKATPLESEVESRFIKLIKRNGGATWKFKAPNRRGVSDRIVLYFGRVVFVEMKREGKDLNGNQTNFRLKVIEHGGEFATVVGDEGNKLFMSRLKKDLVWYKKAYALMFVWVSRISEKYGK